jgi:hypothetical protein
MAPQPEISSCASAAAGPWARPEQPRKHDTEPTIRGYGVDMSTPQKSLKYRAGLLHG